MAKPSRKPSSSKLEHQRLCWHYGDLVAYGFRRLQRKYDRRTAELPDPTYIENALAALSIDGVETQEGLTDQLQSSLLPILQSQIDSLLQALDLPGLRNDPAPKLALVLQIQAKLDYSLDRIKYLVVTLCPDRESMSNRTDDHDLKGLKSYRLCRLRMKFEGILSWRICEIFETANDLIQQMELSSGPSNSSWSEIESLKKSLNRTVCCTSDTIKSIADCFQASELALAQDSWRHQRLQIEQLHQSILEELNPSTHTTGIFKQYSDQFVGQSVIRLARLTLPIFKLSRIFFAKLSKRGLAQERIPIHTEISSEQISILAESVEHVVEDLRELKFHLDSANQPDEDARSEDFVRIAGSLKNCFVFPLLLVSMYFIPLIPDTEALQLQKYYQNWFVTWNNQMALAIHNFTLVAKTYTDDIP
ncbi:hypothetical protein PGT21_015361 [Puccinia graminis f. sp. tritici]|uniref:Uncharacterized protein n=1 Tax=Puccinia graminis f. sp. tritici TaxID=56615 RepID=A0A5B0MK91_PUCGR|nr:hypothetical protein PGT21_015361 [Puccinia graminis f. sp. tritici]KAA1126834.1 hypothetical protein PGTUg99_026575 [Puccinia graminis f. sp. tritici]